MGPLRSYDIHEVKNLSQTVSEAVQDAMDKLCVWEDELLADYKYIYKHWKDLESYRSKLYAQVSAMDKFTHPIMTPTHSAEKHTTMPELEVKLTMALEVHVLRKQTVKALKELNKHLTLPLLYEMDRITGEIQRIEALQHKVCTSWSSLSDDMKKHHRPPGYCQYFPDEDDGDDDNDFNDSEDEEAFVDNLEFEEFVRIRTGTTNGANIIMANSNNNNPPCINDDDNGDVHIFNVLLM